MAEIKIQKKAPVWPWIILILILGIIGYLIYAFGTSDEIETPEEITEVTTVVIAEENQNPLNNSTLSAYVTLIKNDPNQMGLDHEFTNEALMKLIEATVALSDEIGYDIQKDISEVRKLAEKITRDPFETTHANSIREAVGILSKVMQNMQQKAFPSFSEQASDLKNAAEAIQPDVLTLDQKEAVKNFFREAADFLEKINSNTPEV